MRLNGTSDIHAVWEAGIKIEITTSDLHDDSTILCR